MKTTAIIPDKSVNRHDIARSLNWLNSNELRAREFVGEAPDPRKLSLVGRWYLPTNLVKRLVIARLPRSRDLDSHDSFLQRISGCSLQRLLLGLAPVNQHVSKLAADAVFLKNNIRAFYFDQGVTLKCSNPILELAKRAITNEITVRRLIKDAGTIRVPRLVHTEITTDGCFLVEQLLNRARLFEPMRDGKVMAKGLFNFYLRNGMVQRSIADAVPLPQTLSAIESLFSQFGLNNAALRKFVDRNFIKRDITKVGVPFGLTHGDMSVGNLLVEDGITYVVDWERAHYAPIFTDFHKLFRQIPGLQPQLTELFQKWKETQPLDTLSSEDDAIFGQLVQLSYLYQRSKDVLGKSEEEITKPWYAKTLARHTRFLVKNLESLGE
ncbi:MAG: aminoglycoside phosphotransferase family protein [Fimbriimonadaceae bacterium]|nr:aminoglycoside phosphotransferase family protein [Alphaproteobacteria bacterium]